MTSIATKLLFDADGFEDSLQRVEQPQWLIDLRRDAWEQFSKTPWPDRRDEEWIRSDRRLFQLEKFHVPDADPSAHQSPEPLLSGGVDLGGQLLSVDNTVCEESLDPELADAGVVFGSLQRLASEHSDLVQRHLFSAVDRNYDRFAMLHAAFWSGGQILYVPRSVTIEKPIHIGSFLNSGAADLSHTLIILEDGAEATVLQEASSFSREGSGMYCGAVELIQAPGSHLRYVNLQDWGYKTFHFAHQQAVVDRDASLQWTIAAMGAGFAKVNQQVRLVGPGANSQVNGVMFTEGRQHQAYHTLQHHCADNCRSDFLYKSAQQDNSHTVWKGMIKVDERAQKTDGYQRNDNLLLSDTARADSIPGLEIEADDVRCTHGSTSSKVDPEQIFYAQCRGYTENEAVRMIVTGFFQQIFDRITIQSVRESLGRTIARQVRGTAPSDGPAASLKEEAVLEALKKVIDPELFVNIVDLGLIYEVQITEKPGGRQDVHIDMTMTSPMCPAGPQLVSGAKSAIGEIQTVDEVDVKVVMDPPWTQDRMTEDARDQLGIF